MAIKGKGKTRARRPGTNAPRPVVVAPKRPFLARPSTRWGALGLIVAIVGVTLFLAWRKQNEDQRKERQGIAIEELSSRVSLATQSVAIPGAGADLSVLPEFVAQIEAFKAGQVKAGKVKTDNDDVADLLDGAADTLGKIEIPEDLRNTEFTNDIVDARVIMAQGMRAMKVAVNLLLTAADLEEGKARTDVLTQTSEQAAVAQRLFDFGHQKITNIRTELGTFSGFNPLPPEGGGAPLG